MAPLPSMPLRLAKLAAVAALVALAVLPYASAKSGFGEACAQSSQHLDANTYALVTDCDAQTYCADNSTCAHRGCRKDLYPFGYNGVAFDHLPPLCPSGSYCPDEMDRCIQQSAIGGQCQKDRDDECAPAPNWHELAGYLNTNGSICLNYTCYWSNVTLGQACVNDNTQYTAYDTKGAAYAFIISRDNCANGLYCDGTSLQCTKKHNIGMTCTAHKECLSYNCKSNGKCGRAADEPIHPPAWKYVLVGLGIVVIITGVMTALWFFHRKVRKENQERLEQYYNEQVAYRRSIMSMSHAKNSLLNLPPNTTPDAARQSLLGGDDGYGYSSAVDPALPPNMRRESSTQWSETESEVLIVDQNSNNNNNNNNNGKGKSSLAHTLFHRS